MTKELIKSDSTTKVTAEVIGTLFDTVYTLDVNTITCNRVNDWLCAVCVAAGYIMSYWNRPFFPDWCGDTILDDHVIYDTLVRIFGSFSGVAETFKVVANHYEWTHAVLISDDNTSNSCWYVAKPFIAMFSDDENYTFTWLRLDSEPTDKELDDVLQQIRSRTRGFWLHWHFMNVILLLSQLYWPFAINCSRILFLRRIPLSLQGFRFFLTYCKVTSYFCLLKTACQLDSRVLISIKPLNSV